MKASAYLGVICSIICCFFCPSLSASSGWISPFSSLKLSEQETNVLQAFYQGDRGKALNRIAKYGLERDDDISILKLNIESEMGPVPSFETWLTGGDNPMINNYIIYHEIKRALTADNIKDSEEAYRLLFQSVRSPYLINQSLLAYAAYYDKKGALEKAKSQVSRIVRSRYNDRITNPRARILAIKIALQQRDLDGVLAYYSDLIKHYPESDSGEHLWKKLNQTFQTKIPLSDILVTAYDHFEYLENLYNQRLYDKIYKEANYIATHFPNFRLMPDVFFILGQTYYKRYQLGNAIPALQKVLVFENSREQKYRVFYQTGLCYHQAGRYGRAKKHFLQALRNSHRGKYDPDIYYHLAQYSRIMGESKEFKPILKNFKLYYKRTDYYKRYQWDEKSNNLLKKTESETYPELKIAFDTVWKSMPKSKDIVLDWYQRVFSQKDQIVKPETLFTRSLSFLPISYYAKNMLDRITNSDFETQKGRQLREGQHKGFRDYFRLYKMGYGREALEDLIFKFEDESKPELWIVFAKAYLHYRFNEPELAIRTIRSSMSEEEARFGSCPPALIRLYYPLVYWDLVTKYATKYRVDPLFVMAVMREESLFQKDVVSSAGAMGLMQLMPGTGRDLAKRLGLRWKNSTFLLDPETNIRCGVFYLSWLLNSFNHILPFSVAAYNAGPKTVSRWIGARKVIHVEDFYEHLSYPETRDYLQRVMTSYLIYTALYKDEVTFVQ